MKITRGDIWSVDLGKPIYNTNIQKGVRPAIIVSNEMCNTYSPVIMIIPMTSSKNKNKIPTHVTIPVVTGVKVESIALVEQSMPLDKHNLIKKLGHCNDDIMMQIDKAIIIQHGIKTKTVNYPPLSTIGA